jgi:RNA polymerase sigma-70 factor (ECF subfamily)
MVRMDTERVWREFHAGLRAFVHRRVRRPDDVDDIVQRVFVNVHRSLPVLRDEERLAAWLYRTAHRAIADHYRAPFRRRELPSGATTDLSERARSVTVSTEADGVVERTAEGELAACLLPLLDGVSAVDREALQFVDVDGLSQAEAARRLGLSVPGMKSRVQRARRRLRTVVEACCRVDLDRRGGVIAYERRADACGCKPSGGAPGAPCEPASR